MFIASYSGVALAFDFFTASAKAEANCRSVAWLSVLVWMGSCVMFWLSVSANTACTWVCPFWTVIVTLDAYAGTMNNEAVTMSMMAIALACNSSHCS